MGLCWCAHQKGKIDLLASIYQALVITHENYLVSITLVLKNNLQVLYNICWGMQENTSVIVNFKLYI